MRNAINLLLIIVCAVVVSTSCTRISNEGNLPEAEEEPAVKQSGGDLTIPSMQVPDVKINQDAEIPDFKGAADVKVPDVQINAAEGVGDIDETRVDGADEIVDEP